MQNLLDALLTPLCLFGALLAVYLMQLTSFEAEDGVDPTPLRWMRRFSLAVVALALLSSVLFADAKQWQAWPSHFALIVGVILVLGVRTLAIRARIKREGRRRRPESYPRPTLARQPASRPF
jgi:peptidoglycan/LPS O-acetylase OafA/YrhL